MCTLSRFSNLRARGAGGATAVETLFVIDAYDLQPCLCFLWRCGPPHPPLLTAVARFFVEVLDHGIQATRATYAREILLLSLPSVHCRRARRPALQELVERCPMTLRLANLVPAMTARAKTVCVPGFVVYHQVEGHNTCWSVKNICPIWSAPSWVAQCRRLGMSDTGAI